MAKTNERLSHAEFDKRAFAFQKDLTEAFIDLLEKHDPHPAITGSALVGLIKNIVHNIGGRDANNFRKDFLTTMINDLHDYRHDKL